LPDHRLRGRGVDRPALTGADFASQAAPQQMDQALAVQAGDGFPLVQQPARSLREAFW